MLTEVQFQNNNLLNMNAAKKSPSSGGPAKLAAVGMWTEISVRLFSLPSLTFLVGW